jgi:hypothetical protein
MVVWDKLYQPKHIEGPKLRDPEVLSSFLEAKTWWKWLDSKGDLWSRIWHKKYYPNTKAHDLIHPKEIFKIFDLELCLEQQATNSTTIFLGGSEWKPFHVLG